MPDVTTDLQPPINHVFVDFENVHEIDLAIIGSKSVNFTLLLGSRQTKLEVSLVEKLLEHAGSVHLVRLASAGRNALDFTLAYYIGRAVAADPTGCFHIVSEDTGYDPLIEHLRSNHVQVSRHDSFATVPFAGPAEFSPRTPAAAAPKAESQSDPKAQPPALDARATQVLEHFRKHPATRPRSKKKLVSFLVARFGHRITEAEVLNLVEYLGQGGHLTIGEKGTVTYHLKPE
jgi:hypothetical protein